MTETRRPDQPDEETSEPNKLAALALGIAVVVLIIAAFAWVSSDDDMTTAQDINGGWQPIDCSGDEPVVRALWGEKPVLATEARAACDDLAQSNVDGRANARMWGIGGVVAIGATLLLTNRSKQTV